MDSIPILLRLRYTHLRFSKMYLLVRSMFINVLYQETFMDNSISTNFFNSESYKKTESTIFIKFDKGVTFHGTLIHFPLETRQIAISCNRHGVLIRFIKAQKISCLPNNFEYRNTETRVFPFNVPWIPLYNLTTYIIKIINLR